MKAIEIQAPNKIEDDGRVKIFLAGSIEMGKAEDWQKRIVKELGKYPIQFLNPRRDDWDSSWEQTKENEQFSEQVNWELDGLEASDFIILYFDPETKSPISLLELGIHACCNPDKLVVLCPDGFWRKGNVDITCEKYGVKQVNDFDELIDLFKIE
jgi:hypothetical protein